MTYLALARKWRPKRFSELVGQEHVLRPLAHALDSGRVHHAFLFTGTRGVGKTTIARILAKCLNCETGVRSDPCGECVACRHIDAGRFVDLIEVDAASRTKVDDTRELLDNVQYAPTSARYKVYLIDEVHMLSTHSFNALLKTLEEPPPHVKFLLATTDPQKLPATVLSRCLQFNLRRLPANLIFGRMKAILEAEGLPYEPAGVRLVAQAADGSLRDALSLLDQLIAFGGGNAGEAEARAMLGTVARDHVARLADALASLDASALLGVARELEPLAPDYAQLLDELASLLARVALKQTFADYDVEELYPPELLERLAKAIAPEDLQLFYQSAVIGRRDLPLAPEPRTGFEMTLLRMIAFRPAGKGTSSERPRAQPAPSPEPREEDAPRSSAPPAPRVAVAGSAAAGDWAAILTALDLQGAGRQLASHCALLGRNGPVVRFALDPHHQLMRTKAQEEKLAQALSQYFGEPVRVEIEVRPVDDETPALAEQRVAAEQLAAAGRSLEDDPTVQALKERFGATLVPESVRPVR